MSFINHEDGTFSNGNKDAGLFCYLRTLTSSNGHNGRDVIATVFRGVQNRMVSGYLLREVVRSSIAQWHPLRRFAASHELNTLGVLYKSMLREMRGAAGDSGEFYAARTTARFMVPVTDPHLSESVLESPDPQARSSALLMLRGRSLKRGTEWTWSENASRQAQSPRVNL